ncbi:MAG: 50S ribosomal protein L32, partial [Sweet potato little leaf phytoplasma]|nr:50S ribosomal protein L32 [Sweet potato little leaf phytoplasma]
LCPDTNKFTLPHRLTKNGGNFYKNKLISKFKDTN